MAGITRARGAAATALLQALEGLPSRFTEAQLAQGWMTCIAKDPAILDYGWYQPPPHGISVLVGNPPKFERLKYRSLRDEANWPSSAVEYSAESIIYPYFSAVDTTSGMIGDFVGTFYAGSEQRIRHWISTVYRMTLNVAAFVDVGKTVSEVFHYARNKIKELGAANQNFSLSAGYASDIGHTIPWFNAGIPPEYSIAERVSPAELAKLYSQQRSFISEANHTTIGETFAMTIEPQVLAPGFPMASFHVIVVIVNGEKVVIKQFRDIFHHFGMSQWM